MASQPLSPGLGGGEFAASGWSGFGVFETTAKASHEYDADEQRWSASMARVQAGDKQEYQRLLEELSRVISRYLVSRFGYHDFIDDCTQEILLAIHNARHTYQADRLFRPWLFAIVRNKAIDFLRKRKSYDTMLASQAEEALQENDSGDSVDAPIVQGQLIDALAQPLKQAVVLTKLIGFSNAEAARKLNISETAVKVRVHRGIARLKQMLEGDE